MSETEQSAFTFADAIRALESMDPTDLRALMPPEPTTAELIAHDSELAGVAITDLTIDGPHGPLPARRYRRPDDERPRCALVWVHGGGFIGGDLDMPESNWVALRLAASGVPVLAVDYAKCLRGIHYPVPSDDVLATWLWAVDHAADLGVGPAGLHLGGASAGANLAAGVAKRLRDGAGPAPASLLLAYGLFHAELPPFSPELSTALSAVDRFSFPPDTVRSININFVGTETALTDHYAFPANGDVAGLPAVLLLNSEADELRASGEAFAEQLAAAGVDVSLVTEPGTSHGHLNTPFDEPGRRSLDRMVEWMTR